MGDGHSTKITGRPKNQAKTRHLSLDVSLKFSTSDIHARNFCLSAGVSFMFFPPAIDPCATSVAAPGPEAR